MSLAALWMLLAQDNGGNDGAMTGGQVAAIMAISNLVTATGAAFGVWWINWRKQKQEFAKEDREQNRIDRRETAAEWERLVDLYGARISNLEKQERETQQRLIFVEESERACQRRLRRYENKLRTAGLWTDSDNFDPPSPVPRPPEAPK